MFQTTNQYSLLMLCMLTTYESGMHIQAPKCTYLPCVVFITHVDISKSSKFIQFPIAAGYPLVIFSAGKSTSYGSMIFSKPPLIEDFHPYEHTREGVLQAIL